HWSAHLDPPSLAPLAAAADLAIGGAGVSVWERMCLGLPALVVAVAPNQRVVARHLHERGLVRLIGDRDTVDAAAIAGALAQALSDPGYADWSRRCFAICDGGGTARVLDAMHAIARDGETRA